MAPPPTTDPPTPKLIDDFMNLTLAQWMEHALAALIASGTKPNGYPHLSIWRAATQFDIPWSTLTDWWNGTPTHKKGHTHELLVTAAQEEVLVDWIIVMGCWGIPMTATIITNYVAGIVGYTVGNLWVRCFKTHHPELKVKWSSTLEKCHAASLNPALVNVYFDILEDTVKTYNISAENIYNMDEKGIQLSIGQKVKAFVDRSQRDVYSVEDGNQELVTMMEAISTVGWSMHPSAIYQGMCQDLEWGRNNPCNASQCCFSGLFGDHKTKFIGILCEGPRASTKDRYNHICLCQDRDLASQLPCLRSKRIWAFKKTQQLSPCSHCPQDFHYC